MTDLNYGDGITLTPRLHSIFPNFGSLGGTLIVAEVRGIGNMTMNATLITSSGLNICASVMIMKYGEL
jgi:hypothetical protein